MDAFQYTPWQNNGARCLCLFSSGSVSLTRGDACLSQIIRLEARSRLLSFEVSHSSSAFLPSRGAWGSAMPRYLFRGSKANTAFGDVNSAFGEVIRSFKEYTQWKEENEWLWKAIREAREAIPWPGSKCSRVLGLVCLRAGPHHHHEAIMSSRLCLHSACKCSFWEGGRIPREDCDLLGILPPKCKNSLGTRYF